MNIVEVTLLGVTIAAISSSITLILSTRGVAKREDLIKLIENQRNECKVQRDECRKYFEVIIQDRDRLDHIRNGKIDRLEEIQSTFATKEDISRIENSICEIKKQITTIYNEIIFVLKERSKL